MSATATGRSAGGLLCRAGALALLLAAVLAGRAHAASVSMCDVPITMSDGTVLSANIHLPSTSGHFPTVLTATGYNKDAANPTGQECGSSQGIAGDEPGLTEKGLAVMVIDDRGTGASGGKWDYIAPAGFEGFFSELVDLGGVAQATPELLGELCQRYALEMDPDSVPGLVQRFGLSFPAEPLQPTAA